MSSRDCVLRNFSSPNHCQSYVNRSATILRIWFTLILPSIISVHANTACMKRQRIAPPGPCLLRGTLSPSKYSLRKPSVQMHQLGSQNYGVHLNIRCNRSVVPLRKIYKKIRFIATKSNKARKARATLPLHLS